MLKNLGTIVFMKDFKVTEISEISGYDDKTGHITYNLVYKRPEDNA